MAKARIYAEPGFVEIMCPGCGCAHILATKVPFRGKNNVWEFNNDFENPTFKPSLVWKAGKYVSGHEDFNDEGFSELNSICHSVITDGKIQFLSDCTHHLKGQTVELPDVEG